MRNPFKNPRFTLFLVFLITMIGVAIAMPKTPVKIHYKNINIDTTIGGYDINLFGGRIHRDLELKQGLDIAGGVSVLLKADMSKIPEEDREEALKSLRDVIEKRVNLLGISESNVQTSKVGDEYRIIVELAGVFDTTKALDVIGQVAQLEFKTEAPTIYYDTKDTKFLYEKPADFEEANKKALEEYQKAVEEGKSEEELKDIPQQRYIEIPDWKSSDLTGADLRKASVVLNPQTGQPEIQLQFSAEGAKKFKTLTEENLNKRIAIFLDEQMLMAPTVNSVISNGQAVITGQFTVDEAKNIATQLNAGALPVPVEVLEQRTVGPTLGQESVNKSLIAGGIGLALVVLFMIAYYGWLGVFASISLVIYGIITLALYKFIPVVLTLPGLAGFVLSIGMAVDANILIFERIKEELREGKPRDIAFENGFGRSWDSIRDANVATLITAFILFNPFNWSFLPQSGPVRGFALTLSLGIFISLFTGVIITRNLVRVFYKKPKKHKKTSLEKSIKKENKQKNSTKSKSKFFRKGKEDKK